MGRWRELIRARKKKKKKKTVQINRVTDSPRKCLSVRKGAWREKCVKRKEPKEEKVIGDGNGWDKLID